MVDLGKVARVEAALESHIDCSHHGAKEMCRSCAMYKILTVLLDAQT
jgi:hypothetical protein